MTGGEDQWLEERRDMQLNELRGGKRVQIPVQASMAGQENAARGGRFLKLRMQMVLNSLITVPRNIR